MSREEKMVTVLPGCLEDMSRPFYSSKSRGHVLVAGKVSVRERFQGVG